MGTDIHSVDSLVAEILDSGDITTDRIMDQIDQIPNPFDQLDYISAIRTFVEVGLQKGGVIKTDEDVPTTLRFLEKLAIGEARSTSEIDALTGLLNRGEVEENMRTPKKKYATLMMDIDHFKRVNDTYGHQIGDYVIKNVARIIQETLREYFVGRYGGEEFYAELNRTDKEGAKIAAERIRGAMTAKFTDYLIKDLERNDIVVPDRLRRHKVTLSIGVADEDQGKTPYEVRARADDSLMLAKKYGRNMVVVDGQDPLKNFSTGKRTLLHIANAIEKSGERLTNFSNIVRECNYFG